jgi:hypothetical protein
MDEGQLICQAENRFRVTEEEVTARSQSLDETVENSDLLIGVEVNQDVTTENDVEVFESIVVFQIMKVVDHMFLELLPNGVTLGARLEISPDAFGDDAIEPVGFVYASGCCLQDRQ